jgi:hypothetical protein
VAVGTKASNSPNIALMADAASAASVSTPANAELIALSTPPSWRFSSSGFVGTAEQVENSAATAAIRNRLYIRIEK